MHVNHAAAIEISADQAELHFKGDWTIAGIVNLEPQLKSYAAQISQKTTLNASHITALDSAGALILQNFLDKAKSLGKSITVIGLTERFQSLLSLITQETDIIHHIPAAPRLPNFVYLLGQWSVTKWTVLMNFLTFLGEVTSTVFRSTIHPYHIQWRLMLRNVDEMGYRAMPIVALLTFLVGIVLTYQIAIQLQSYNANIYIVDITGLVILREFGPLVTAIIASGRTSTAYTAQIGTMKVNQEIDALNTMGISPIERLVTPKIFALLIAIPLLTVWADGFGVLGCMVMSKYQLGINYYPFFVRFQHAIPVKHLVVGLVKAPVFALIVATVGCFQGFQVAATADSVGKKTTQSAVQSIFLIIIADAIFSILFSWRGI
jgi:phospholipid/cholesterol/gamma-HCH transport system permease protein